MKTFLAILAVLLVAGGTQAAVIFDLGDVVRPGGGGTANTILFGTGLTSPNVAPTMSYTAGPPTSLEFSTKGGYFLVYFDKQSLAIGETIQVDFTVKFQDANGAARGFRIGMFDSDTGTIFTSDQSSTTPTGFVGAYPGYFSTHRITTTDSSDSETVRRNTSNQSPLGGVGTTLTGNTTGLNATLNTDYDAQFSITRTDTSEVRLDFQFGTQPAETFTDSAPGTTSFNTLGFQLTNTVSGNPPTVMTFSELSISTIPEPSTVALVFCGLAGGAFALGRRRRAPVGLGSLDFAKRPARRTDPARKCSIQN